MRQWARIFRGYTQKPVTKNWKNHTLQPTIPNTFSFKSVITGGSPILRNPSFRLNPYHAIFSPEAFDKQNYQLFVDEIELILVIVIFLLAQFSNTHMIHLWDNSTHFVSRIAYGWEMDWPRSTLFFSWLGTMFSSSPDWNTSEEFIRSASMMFRLHHIIFKRLFLKRSIFFTIPLNSKQFGDQLLFWILLLQFSCQEGAPWHQTEY